MIRLHTPILPVVRRAALGLGLALLLVSYGSYHQAYATNFLPLNEPAAIQDSQMHDLATGAFTVEQDYPATKVQETLKMTLEEDDGDITGQSLNPKRERYKVTGVIWKARNGRYRMKLKRPSPGNVQTYDLTYDPRYKSWEGEVHNTWNNVGGHAIMTKINN